MKRVYILTDFDGTLPPLQGAETVNTDFYKSLLRQNGKLPYSEDTLKGEDVVQRLFQKEFGSHWPNPEYKGNHADLLIPQSTIEVLHELLKMEGINLRIISRNRADYIIAVLRYQGLTDIEICKIKFAGGYKYEEIKKPSIIPIKKESDVSSVWVLDDNKDDLNDMVKALLEKGYLSDYGDLFNHPDEEIDVHIGHVHIINKKPGNFDWKQLLLSVAAFQESTKEVELEIDPDYSSGDENEPELDVRPEQDSPSTPPPSPEIPILDIPISLTPAIHKRNVLQESPPLKIELKVIDKAPTLIAKQQKASDKQLTALIELRDGLPKEMVSEKEAINRLHDKLVQLQKACLDPIKEVSSVSQPIEINKALEQSLINESEKLDAHLNWGDKLVNLVKSFLALFCGPTEQLSPLNKEHRNSFFYPRESETHQQVIGLVETFGKALS